MAIILSIAAIIPAIINAIAIKTNKIVSANIQRAAIIMFFDMAANRQLFLFSHKIYAQCKQ